MQRDALIEALLFYTGEEHTIDELSALLSCSIEETKEAVAVLAARLIGGIVLVCENDRLQLATAPHASEIIATLRHNELSRDLSKAAIETLAIIAYRAPIAKSEIDFIRGVNTTAILRSLLVRGLIRKEEGSDGRGYMYTPTLELLQYFGIKNKKELPDFEETNERISTYMREYEHNTNE